MMILQKSVSSCYFEIEGLISLLVLTTQEARSLILAFL